MKIIKIDGYRDGGTTSIRLDNDVEICIDNRFVTDDDDNQIDNPTNGMLFYGHPTKNQQLSPNESKLMKSNLLKALKKFTLTEKVSDSYINKIKNIN